VLFAVLGVLVVAGGAAAYALKGSDPPPIAASSQAKAAEAPVPVVPVAPEPPASASSPVVAPSSVPAAPTGVKLEVITEPPGAQVMKNGFQVCDATPCEVNAAPNEPLELTAKKDALSGKAKVLAQQDQKVTIKLFAPVKAQPRMCEVEGVDGLKVWRACAP
jgi:hypothetical protein